MRCLVCGCQRKPSHEKRCGTDKANDPACVTYDKFDGKAYRAENKRVAKGKADAIAKIKADAEAKIKADAEAAVLAKKESDEKLIAEAKIQAEKDAAAHAVKVIEEKAAKIAKKQSAREAYLAKVAEEAKVKTEAEAKAKEEAEAKTKADAEAKAAEEAQVARDKIMTPEEFLAKPDVDPESEQSDIVKAVSMSEKTATVDDVVLPKVTADDLIPSQEVLNSEAYHPKTESGLNAKPFETINDDGEKAKGLTREELKDERPAEELQGEITKGDPKAFFAGDKV